MICFVHKCNCFVATLVATYTETDSVNLKMQVYNVRKVHLQGNLSEVFAKDKK